MARPKNQSLPADLSAVALSLFVEKGFAATRLEDVAAKAGIGKGTVYLYFRSKEDLFKAVVRDSIVPALEQGEAMVAEHRGDTKSLLESVLRGWWELIGGTELGGVAKLMISEGRNFPELAEFYYGNVIQRGRGILSGVLQRGVARGEFRPIDVEVAIDIIFAPLLMRAIWRFSLGACCGRNVDHPAESIDHYLDLHFQLLADGLSVSKS